MTKNPYIGSDNPLTDITKPYSLRNERLLYGAGVAGHGILGAAAGGTGKLILTVAGQGVDATMNTPAAAKQAAQRVYDSAKETAINTTRKAWAFVTRTKPEEYKAEVRPEPEYSRAFEKQWGGVYGDVFLTLALLTGLAWGAVKNSRWYLDAKRQAADINVQRARAYADFQRAESDSQLASSNLALARAAIAGKGTLEEKTQA
ncbi:hypothetical protein HYV81_01445 [Candidatus Woesearchaeota archaeon]|nr:hypothetical protein [Candidatus Woesearchaeota archaeon]